MRSKAFQGLTTAALLCMASVPAWAQPRLVGTEFQVNQNRESRQNAPVTAANPSGGDALVVWENSMIGLLGRFYDRDGKAGSQEITLVANKRLPAIPAAGDVFIRKEPSFVFLPNGEFLLFWTEEKDHLVLDHFWENRTILDQDIRGQRFSAKGEPLGASFAVSGSDEGFQRRPKAVLKSGGVMVVWEKGEDWRNSEAVLGRLLTRDGRAKSDVFRVDSGRASEVRSLAIAANDLGDALVAWEADLAANPDIAARFYGRKGTEARGDEFVANASTEGRQRRPAVVATQNGDFLIAWQSFVSGSSTIHGIVGQLYSSAGTRTGGERQLSRGTGEIQISPALTLLKSGKIVVTWMDWINVTPIGIYAAVLDQTGNRLGDEIKISKSRVTPQYKISVGANAHGEIVAVWEGMIDRVWSIAAQRMKVD